MSYAQWSHDFGLATATDPRGQAQHWNLEHETRCPTEVTSFRNDLGARHKEHLAAAPADGQSAARKAWEEVREELKDRTHAYLGLLPAKNPTLPARIYTHAPYRDLDRYLKLYRGRTPPRTAKLKRAYKTGPGRAPVTRFIWLTFQPDGSAPTDDPAQVVHELGLAHFRPDDLVYRMDFPTEGKSLWVPTCFDANFCDAWAPPPPGHSSPWGLTRHLTTGQPTQPELLTEVADHLDYRPQAKLVSPPGPAKVVGETTFNPMANRT